MKREPDTHKGDYGHLLIIGGSPGMTGAVCLSGMAAMRSGAGLATAAVPESLNHIFEIKLTEVMSLPLPETSEHTISFSASDTVLSFIKIKADAVVIGPGISTQGDTVRFIRKVVAEACKPVLIDADAITAISLDKSILSDCESPVILTPHPGEMSRLLGLPVRDIQKERVKAAREFARQFGVTVVLKGHNTVITDGNETCVNLTGNPGMATAGSGDVLAGVIGSLLAGGLDALSAAERGCYIHGLAGDFAARSKGEISLIASDIISNLPGAFAYSYMRS